MTGWVPDILPGFWQCTIPLGPDPDGEGEIDATLIRHGPSTAGKIRVNHAVLALHGFTDYFFNTELADHFANRGFAFYALDLPKCGRSLRAGQTPHFTTDLARYDAGLERALAIIDENTGSAASEKVLVYGHSAGGLIVSLWLDRVHRHRVGVHGRIGGLVLNSPWLDLQGAPILRHSTVSSAIGVVSRIRPRWVLRARGQAGYGSSLHRDYHGEFDFNLQWKPLGGFPVTFGWLHAIRLGQARLQRGLDVGVPNLILRSDHSVAERADPLGLQSGDAVLDVTQIARWAGCIGNRTTIIPVADAKHDVFLSLPQPRQVAYRQLDRWLDHYLDAPDAGP